MTTTATVATELLVPSLRAPQRLGPEVARRASESGLAILAANGLAAQRSLGFVAWPLEVHFMRAEPPHAVRGAASCFARERNAMILPRAALDLPLASADPPLLNVLARHADELHKGLQRPQPFVQRVYELVRSRLESGAGLPALAEDLHMSESSLQRRLQSHGTTHTEIVENVRREPAVELGCQSCPSASADRWTSVDCLHAQVRSRGAHPLPYSRASTASQT